MYHIFFIHSLVEGHLCCFQVLNVLNNAAMNIVEKISLWYGSTSFGYMPKSDIVGSRGRLIPNFLWHHHTDIQSGCTSLHSHQQWRSVLLTPHPFQHKLSSVFFILLNLTGIRCYLRVILICISLITNNVEQSLKCLSAIWDFSVENYLFRSVQRDIHVFPRKERKTRSL